MAKKNSFDVIVIGAGAGGLGVAIGMAKFGFRVLLIEKNADNFGGDCLNTGCIPSKALLHVASQIHNGKLAEQYGWRSEGKTDLQKVWHYVRAKQDKIRAHESAEYLEREEGIETLIGEARFSGKNEVSVGGKTLRAKKILVATGSKPRVLDLPGIAEIPLYTNESLFQMRALPQHLVIIGAGPIGLEMGQAFRRLGAEVTVLDRADRSMTKERPEVSALIQKRLEKEGITFHLSAQIEGFEQGQYLLFKAASSQSKKLKTDAVLMAVGREITYDQLNLTAAGVNLDDRGWPVIDDYLRARGNKNIVFAGDAAHNLLFSHAAELHTTVLLTNFFTPAPFKKKFKTGDFSWVTFTDPEVATFGLSEKELQEKGLNYEKLDFEFGSDDRAVASDYEYGRLILFTKKNRINPRNGKILGGTMVAPNAGEMIQELILAKQQGLGAGAIFNKTYPYPTQSRVTKMALVEKFSGEIDGRIKRLLRWLYR